MNPESELLKKWALDASVPSNFNSVVWRRLEAHRCVSILEAIRQWLTELFARPTVAFAYLSVALVIGLAAGQVQSLKVIRERDSQLEARYVQSVDPYSIRVTK
jgi:hypothetical protein